jgi:GTP-binding protein
LNAISKSIKAQNGGPGGKNKLHGKCGEHLIVRVPLGTSVVNMETKKVVDLDFPNQTFIGAYGGRGGKGNLSLAKNNHEFDQGSLGGQENFLLELKTLADVGLVGVPNAGKSSFLRAVSNAHPKVADYPFTTLNPFVGTVDFEDLFQFKIADIPGLIEGAHKNKGLGHSFLKHIIKSKIIGYVIDASLHEPWKDVQICMREMELYNEDLLKKKSFIIANKLDIGPRVEENCEKLKSIFPGIEVFSVSAKEGTNVKNVTQFLRELIEKKEEI